MMIIPKEGVQMIFFPGTLLHMFIEWVSLKVAGVKIKRVKALSHNPGNEHLPSFFIEYAYPTSLLKKHFVILMPSLVAFSLLGLMFAVYPIIQNSQDFSLFAAEIRIFFLYFAFALTTRAYPHNVHLGHLWREDWKAAKEWKFQCLPALPVLVFLSVFGKLSMLWVDLVVVWFLFRLMG